MEEWKDRRDSEWTVSDSDKMKIILEVIKVVHTEDVGGLEADSGSIWILLKPPGLLLDQI